MRIVLSWEGEAINRLQGDQAMRPMVPVCPRQTARGRIPGATSLPTSMKSPVGFSRRVFLEGRAASFASNTVGVDFFLAMFPLLPEQNALRAKSRSEDRRSQEAFFDCTAREFRNFVFPKRQVGRSRCAAELASFIILGDTGYDWQ